MRAGQRKGLVNLETQSIRHELFDRSNPLELVQTLLAPSIEIVTSSPALSAEGEQPQDESPDDTHACILGQPAGMGE